MRVLLALFLAAAATAFPNGLPFCVLRPEVQTTWAEQIGTTHVSFNQTCYNSGDELIVKLESVRGNDFHGFVMRSDAGQFVRRHGFGGYRWLGDEANPDQSCITHVFPGPKEENGKRIKTFVVAKLLVPSDGIRTPTRIIIEATAIKSFDDDVWLREWQSGVYSIARASINICPRVARPPAPRRDNRGRPLRPSLKISRDANRRAVQSQTRRPALKIAFDPHQRCKQKSDAGRCPNSPSGVIEWVQPFYYDTEAKTCRKFFYSGCGGNANRFDTAADCERWCTGGETPCAKKQNKACPPGAKYTWKPAYFLNEASAQCLHYWYRSCSAEDVPQFGEETDCRRQCLGIEEEPTEAERFLGPKGRCFALFDKDLKMCPIWATEKICSPYPEHHQNHWAHHNCRLSCCSKHGL